MHNRLAHEIDRVSNAISVTAFTISPARRPRLWLWTEKEIQKQTLSEASTSTSSRQTSLRTLRQPLPTCMSWGEESEDHVHRIDSLPWHPVNTEDSNTASHWRRALTEGHGHGIDFRLWFCLAIHHVYSAEYWLYINIYKRYLHESGVF